MINEIERARRNLIDSVCAERNSLRRQVAEARRLTYLAVPYSHPDPIIRNLRYRAANEIAGRLAKEGVAVYSPISHWHPIALQCDLPKGWDFWGKLDEAFLRVSHTMIILMLPGYDTSTGIDAEVKLAMELGLKIGHIQPTDLELRRWGLAP